MSARVRLTHPRGFAQAPRITPFSSTSESQPRFAPRLRRCQYARRWNRDLYGPQKSVRVPLSRRFECARQFGEGGRFSVVPKNDQNRGFYHLREAERPQTRPSIHVPFTDNGVRPRFAEATNGGLGLASDSGTIAHSLDEHGGETCLGNGSSGVGPLRRSSSALVSSSCHFP
jgi:hypothetical protein